MGEDELIFDDLVIDDDLIGDDEGTALVPWRILVVDDEESVHQTTTFALSDFSYEGRALDILHAYSAEEALRIMEQEEDIAVIFLDVVMESDHAGLDCVRQIREVMDNQDVSIVLRTGQPGFAPEKGVILGYEINDYKLKTELTLEKLFMTLVASLRAYSKVQKFNELKSQTYGVLEAQTSLEQSAIDLLPFPLFHTDQLNSITGVNQALVSLVGIDSDHMIGKDYGDVLPDEISHVLQGLTLSVDDSALPKNVPITLNDGVSHVLRIGSYALRHDAPGGWICVLVPEAAFPATGS